MVVRLARQDKDGQHSVLRVGEAKQRDIGKRRARIDPGAMKSMGVEPGDIITITGSRTSCAAAWPADEDERHADTVRIDGQTRKNAGAAVGETVRIAKSAPQTARSVSLVPLGGGGRGNGGGDVGGITSTDSDFVEFVRGKIAGLPVVGGDEISVMILGSPKEFRVSGTQPRGTVVVSEDTKVSISAESDSGKGAHITYDGVGGLVKEVKSMREIVELPLRHPEIFAMLGVEPHSGILLYGPPGCGKTLLAKALAGESGAKMFTINGPEIITKYYGDTEARLREIFEEAKGASPSMIFIDEIDAIAPRREESRGDVEKRVVAQLLALMDGLNDRGNVMVLGATNRPDGVDPALRRPGRFDREFEISVPNEDGRHEILLIHTRGMPMAPDMDVKKLAPQLHGYTGADIKSLCREAAMKAIRRYLPGMTDLGPEEEGVVPTDVLRSMQVTLADFYDAMQEVVPTAMREFYVERPTTKWGDIGGLDGVKESLADNLVTALMDPDRFAKMGVRAPRGALVYGPPGCGKTMLGMALAAETGANTILVRGPEILSKWVGESEKAVREIFRKAKSSAPCVIIFDELDSIARHRSPAGGAGIGDGRGGGDQPASGAGETVLSQLLTEIEGASPRVVVMGITNRPDMLDRSLLRTGRLDLSLYAAPPDEAGRRKIIEILTSRMPLAGDVHTDEIAATTQNYTGADLAALCREAAVSAIKSGSETVSGSDFEAALKQTGPSITEEMEKWYGSVREGISNVVTPPAGDNNTFYG